jgi:hypothetical protein
MDKIELLAFVICGIFFIISVIIILWYKISDCLERRKSIVLINTTDT